MKIARAVVCVMSLSVLLLWLPSGSGAVLTSQLCQGIGNDLWGQWMNGTLPKNDASIDTLLKAKQDCPQLDKSISRMVNDIKAHQQKQAEAERHVKKAGEKYQSPIYDPGGMPTRSGPAATN